MAKLSHPKGVCVDASGNIFVCDALNFRIRKINALGVISTFAGTGVYGHDGDGSQATAAKIGQIYGIAIDRNNNIYFSDETQIRKITTSGIISTIAGNGTSGFSGDGGPATAAVIGSVGGIAIDSMGNIYFGDKTNIRIRKINTAGIISTIAGTGISGYSGDGGPATSATFILPTGVSLDRNDNLYIADAGDYRIRKINNSGIISTVAGCGISGSSGDGGLATSAKISQIYTSVTDYFGNLYIPDQSMGKVRRVDYSTGIISTIAGDGTPCGYSGDGGQATMAQLCSPHSICIDKHNTIYFSEEGNNILRRITYSVNVAKINTHALNISIVPNPINNYKFSVQINSEITESANLVITNVTGIKLKELIVNTNSIYEIQLDEVSGMYFAKVSSMHGTYTEKIIVNK